MPAAKKPAPATSPRARPAPARRAPAAKTATATPVIPVRTADPAGDKPRKAKVVRDSFRIPASEYAVLQALKERAAQAGHPAKKSEVLRAGVRVLAAMGDSAFVTALAAIPAAKAARPAKT